jgi:hypothetical protein
MKVSLTVVIKQFVYDSHAPEGPTKFQVSSLALHCRNKRPDILIQPALTCQSEKTLFREKDTPFKQTSRNFWCTSNFSRKMDR